ncbi:conserved hypothetical protein [Hahella chejuensis KCTC 2396]|uniref:Uncharacterized protein n=1 Tax=Hahella chejuensis (strain KCTC 2396) TaxID=349521 RepID=Q2SHC0_HAHCH|nr:sulfotransferase [Hahella chejuensis]ABC29954.1 conserved hypothetical protein [Hahella chejuensis KCTC 2396]
MESQVHFIAGLPRSGSTLLSGIFRQNPRFYAAISSPVCALMSGCLEQMGAESEFYTLFDENRRKLICRGIFDAYYQPNSDYALIFDTNRMWPARLHQLVELFDNFKVICCVRNPAWVMDSFERVCRSNPFEYSRMFNPQSRQTVYTRCEALAAESGSVGMALTALKEAFYGELSERLLLIDYDLLTQYPQKTISLLYQFIGQREFPHDFNHVEFDADEFDHAIGVKGLHRVRKKVEFRPRPSILPPDLFKKYSELAFWLDTSGTNASCIAPRQ